MREYDRAWAEIDLDAIYKNAESMRESLTEAGKCPPALCAVIKADGYGHGAIPVAKTVENLVWGFAVANAQEGFLLRQHGIKKPVLVLGYVDKADYEECIKNQIRITLYEADMAEEMVRCVREYRKKTGDESARMLVHIKLDTGMGRLGFLSYNEELQEISARQIREALSNQELFGEGCYTHYSKADEKDKTFSKLQHERFLSMIKRLKDLGISFTIHHSDNSAGIIDLPGWQGDMVRMGISLYGLYPSQEVNKRRLALFPAMSLRSHLVQVKTVPAGTPISYGGTYVTERETRVGTVPIGYADGYPRSLSNKGEVLVCGRRVPIIGRICMDQLMVDLTDVPQAKRLTKVTLIGKDGGECIPVEEAATLAGTFNYEFICDISKRVPRVFYRDGKVVGSKDYFTDQYEDF